MQHTLIRRLYPFEAFVTGTGGGSWLLSCILSCPYCSLISTVIFVNLANSALLQFILIPAFLFILLSLETVFLLHSLQLNISDWLTPFSEILYNCAKAKILPSQISLHSIEDLLKSFFLNSWMTLRISRKGTRESLRFLILSQLDKERLIAQCTCFFWVKYGPD